MRFCMLSLFITVFHFSPVTATETIHFVYEDKEVFPLVLGKGDQVQMPNPGYSIELIRMVCKKMNSTATFTRVPWKRCLNGLKANTYDALIQASYKKERLNNGWYPTLLYKHTGAVNTKQNASTVSYMFYHKRSSPFTWDGKKVTGLEGKKVGAILGYSIVADLHKKGIPVSEFLNTAAIHRALQDGTIAAYAGLEGKADKEMGGQKNIVKIKRPIKTKEYYIMFSKGFMQEHKATAQIFWETLAAIRSSKEGAELSKKYTALTD